MNTLETYESITHLSTETEDIKKNHMENAKKPQKLAAWAPQQNRRNREKKSVNLKNEQ